MAPVKKSDYKNGKLSEEARARLQKTLDRENVKGSMLYKFDRQNKPKKATSVKQPSEASQAASAASTRPKEASAAPTWQCAAGEPSDHDCVDTPPRNKLARARRAREQSDDVDWISIIKHNQKDALMEESHEAALEKKARALIKSGLDEQCAIRRAARKKAHEEKLEFNRQQKEKFARWAKEKQEKQSTNFEKGAVIKGIRVAQLQELAQRRSVEERKIKVREAREVQRVKEEIAKEEKKQLKKKLANRELMKEMILENEAHKKKVLEKEEFERKEAVELQKQYAEILKKQELERNRRLQETYERMQQKEVALLDATAGDREAERIAQEKAEKERQLFEQAALAKEKAKKDKLKADQQACNEAIAQQILDKEARIKKEKADDIAYGKQLAELSLKQEAAEQAKLARGREKMKVNLKYLSEQVAECERRRSEQAAEISETEKQMNSGLLNQIKSGVEGNSAVDVDPKMPFAWRYNVRKCPF